MFEKIIDFITFPFMLISDWIDSLGCKHSWRVVYSESDENNVYQLFVCRNCGSQKIETYKHGDKRIAKLRYCALVKNISQFYIEHPNCYEPGLGTYPFELSKIDEDGSLSGPFYAIRGCDEFGHVIVDCPVYGYSPEVTEEYKIPHFVFKHCFTIIN